MAAIKELFGDNIVGKDGEKVDPESLGGSGKALGIYFSAHWCPPCRGFTPELTKFYNNLRQSDEPFKGKNMNIVFASSDRDEKSFNEYYKEMPWLTLDFTVEGKDKKAKLSKKFKVNGIPTFVVIDGEGNTITANGRSMVDEDPNGENWPWNPKPFSEVFGGKLVKPDKSEAHTDELKGKVKGIYFSAHWCPPCKMFTPKLADTYKKVKEAGKDFEVVFVSSDKDQATFDSYFESMPWLAVPFGDPRKKTLSTLFGVEGIPMFVILNEDDKVISSNGRSDVMADPEGKDFPWYKKPISELTGGAADPINQAKCLIVFTDSSAAAIETAKAAMADQAKKYYSMTDDQDLYFFYTGEDDIVEGLCSFMKLPQKDPMLVITNISDGEYFLCATNDVTAENVAKFCDGVLGGEVEAKKFK